MPIWSPKPFPPGGPKFREIVQAIADDVSSGRLAPGERLPPHRDLADTLGIARGTVARAYVEAEKLGLVRSVVGRGTHVLAPDAGERVYSNLFEPPTVVRDLTTNVPLSGIDPDPAEVLVRLARRPDRSALLRYHPPLGLPRHRMAGVRWLARLGVSATAEDVLVCAGAQHALFVTLSHLASRAHALYVEELTYPGIHGIAEALGLPLVATGMDGEGMSPRSLERAARQRGPGVVYCMPTIHNPTGAVMSDARRRELAAVARARDLFLVEDAANRMLVARPPASMREIAPERTFLVASVSKVLAPGLRVAYVAAPEHEIGGLARRVWATAWMVSPIGAEIAAMWLEDGEVARTLARKRREARRRQALARRAFRGRTLHAHPSALHVWLTLPKGWRTGRLLAEAAAQNIVVTPSSAFWARATPALAAIRISLGGVDDAGELARGLARLSRILG